MTITATRYLHGSPSWVSLETSDVFLVKDFYERIFRWDYALDEGIDVCAEPSASDAVVAVNDGSLTASVAKHRKSLFNLSMPSLWSSYVSVDNIDFVLSSVPAAGGLVLEPTREVSGLGLVAKIADPGGAILYLRESGSVVESDSRSHGSLTWLELEVTDVDKAKKFYGEIFGWDAYDVWLPSDPYAPKWCYTVFTCGVEPVAGAIKPLVSSGESSWCAAFAVDDVDAVVAIAEANRGTLVTAPYDLPIGRQAVLLDPSGAEFSVVSFSERFV